MMKLLKRRILRLAFPSVLKSAVAGLILLSLTITITITPIVFSSLPSIATVISTNNRIGNSIGIDIDIGHAPSFLFVNALNTKGTGNVNNKHHYSLQKDQTHHQQKISSSSILRNSSCNSNDFFVDNDDFHLDDNHHESRNERNDNFAKEQSEKKIATQGKKRSKRKRMRVKMRKIKRKSDEQLIKVSDFSKLDAFILKEKKEGMSSTDTDANGDRTWMSALLSDIKDKLNPDEVSEKVGGGSFSGYYDTFRIGVARRKKFFSNDCKINEFCSTSVHLYIRGGGIGSNAMGSVDDNSFVTSRHLASKQSHSNNNDHILGEKINNGDNDNIVDSIGKSISLFTAGIVLVQSCHSFLAHNEIASKLLSTESAVAVKTIRNIIKNFPEFGVIDIFSEYPTKDIVMSIIALSRLQRAVYSTESALLPTTTTSNYDWFTFDDDNGGDTGGRVGIHLLKRAFQRSKDTLMGKTNNSYTYRNDNDLEIEQNLLSDLAHYSIFANVAYGWKMGLLGGRLHIGDLKTLLSRTGVKEAHVIDTNWKSKTHLPAYFLVRDVKKKKIVLCIRGTLSAKDILTDLCCTAEDLMSHEEEGEETSLRNISKIKYRARAHQGMVNSARGVAKMTHELIKSELDANPDYDLVLVGHSLGGGVASILGTFWKETFPGLTVYAYGCPCVAPLNVYPTIDKSVISVVGEGDPFSCLSLGHLADASIALSKLCEDAELRDEIFNRTKEILNADETLSNDDDIYEDSDTSDDYENEIKWCKDTLESLSNHSNLLTSNGGDERMKTEKFYPPGRVLHMKGNLFSKNAHEVTLTEVRSEDVFRHLKLHPRMFDLSLHIPHRYEVLLSRIWSRVNMK